MSRIKCIFGIKCYRQNLQHILDYQHDEINRQKFNKIICNSDETIFINGQHFSLIIWILENFRNFSKKDRSIIKNFFTSLEENAIIDHLLINNYNDMIIYKQKAMTIQKLWEKYYNNSIIIFLL